MRWVMLASVALLLAPSALAGQVDDEACDEPCGYIVPIIDLEFPDKMLCGGGRLVYADETPEDCFDLMAVGESKELTGTLRVYWDAQEEPTYPILPTDEPITITFSGTQSNPSWLDVKVEPGSMQIGPQDLYDPARYDIDPEGTPIAWYNYREPITVTVTRTDDPDKRSLDKMEDRNGVIALFVKARSTASGDFYREAFGVEEFRFNGCADEAVAAQVCGASRASGDESTPGLAPLWTVAALVALAIARRQH